MFTLLVFAVQLCGCEVRYPKIEDTFENGLKYGNTAMAEQGDYLAMRGNKDGNPALFLYHKPSEKKYHILTADVYYISLFNNRILYKKTINDCLYSYDLQTKEHIILTEYASHYQVRDGFVYYVGKKTDNFLFKYDLSTGVETKIETGYHVDFFWLTEYGLYYANDERNLLMVLPWGEKVDRIVAKEEGAVFRDVMSLGGADILYLKIINMESSATLTSYKASKKETKELFTGSFDFYNLVDGHAVFVHDEDVCAVRLSDGMVLDWGDTLEDYAFIQVMSDCVVYYFEDEETSAISLSIQYYPDVKGQ